MSRDNFPQIAADAANQASRFAAYGPAVQGAIALGRILPAMIVPALKQVSGYEQQPRVYTHANPMTAAATNGVTAQTTINWTANSDFLWTTLSFINGVDGQTQFNYEMQIQFGGNDRNLTNNQTGVHPFALMGNDKIPFMLPKAFVLGKRTVMNLQLTTLSAVAIAYSRVYFIGIDYFDANVLDGTRGVV